MLNKVKSILRLFREKFHSPVDIKKTGGFKGSFANWEDAVKESSGYDQKEFFQLLIESTRAVVEKRAVYERDTVLFDQIDYDWPLLASLLKSAAHSHSLNVIDFGGALGSTYRQTHQFIKDLPRGVQWSVIEQEAIVLAGQCEFETEQLKFYHTISDAAAANGARVVLFAGSLNYLSEPYKYIEEVKKTSAEFLIYDRLPISNEENDVITIQFVPESIHRSSYPMWVFSRKNLDKALKKDWRKIESWSAKFQPQIDGVIWEGAYYQRLQQ